MSRHLASQAGHTSWTDGLCSPEEGAVCKSVTRRTDPPHHSMCAVLWFVGGRKKQSVSVACGHMLGHTRNTRGRIPLKTNFSLACFCDGAVGSWGWDAFPSPACCNQLVALNDRNLLSYRSGDRKSQMSPWNCVPSKGSRGKICFLAFSPASGGCLWSLACGPFLMDGLFLPTPRLC